MIRPLIFLVSTAVMVQASAADFSLRSSVTEVKLLELYTSEGCSSCPPADRWLTELEDDERLWGDLVPVAFHVDYWDYIGWPDRFSRAEFGERQRQYVRRGVVHTVYTPGFIVGGEEWRGWFLDPSLELGEPDRIGELRVDLRGGRAEAVFSPLPELGLRGRLDLSFAVLGFDLTSSIRAGENAGKTLTHDFVALAYGRLPLEGKDGSFQGTFAVPAPEVRASRTAFAAWVSRPDDPRPIQAVGGWFSP
jgi:hypothetical protein